ncbi:hypothetical protein [Mesorhizobium sp. ANAO-SY3R2]|uniref:hypothetical protein n=1 Tax=Mesorhizobium sp. ANAO-SY3R2 TaxID=3166644 RepID=UPI00366CD31E
MLASLFASIATSEAGLAVRRTRRAATAYLAATIFGICGIGFLVGAAYVWAARKFGHVEAALSFGGGFLVVAGLILLVHKLAGRARAREEKRQRKADLATLGTAAAMAAVPALLRSKGGIGALLGPVIALVAYQIYRENRRPDDPDDGDDGVSGE